MGDKSRLNATDAIEITPEMIEAGRAVIEESWVEFTGPLGGYVWDKVLREVFVAMMEAKR